MTALILSPRCAVVALTPNLVLVLWCVWGPAGLFPAQVDAYVDMPHAMACYRGRFAGVPAHLLPPGRPRRR